MNQITCGRQSQPCREMCHKNVVRIDLKIIKQRGATSTREALWGYFWGYIWKPHLNNLLLSISYLTNMIDAAALK